jgi:hypothetical protein
MMDAWKKFLTLMLVFALLSVFFPSPAGFQPVQANEGAATFPVYLPVLSNTLPTIIPEATNILTNQSNQYLLSISPDTVTFIFSRTTPELDRVEPGEIIVSDIASKAPNGYFRKVLTKKVLNGQVVLTTGHATFEEAIEQASLSFTYDFSPADILEVQALPGVTLAPRGPDASPFDPIIVELDGVLLGGSLTASGSLELKMSLEFDFAIRRFSLETMRLVLVATENTALNLVSTGAAEGAEEYEIKRIRMRPVRMAVGGFPIIVQPTIVVMLGVDGSVSAALTMGVTQQLTLSGGVEYVDGDLRPVKGVKNEFNYQKPSISAQMAVTAYASAGLELAFYTTSPLVPEVELELRIGPRLQADQSLCWLLEGLLEVDLEVELKFIKWELAEIETNLASLATPLTYAQKCTLLEVKPYGYHLTASSSAQGATVGNLWDQKAEYKENTDLEVKVGTITLETAATVTLKNHVSQASSNGSAKYEGKPNSLEIPSIITGTVTFDTAWNYNPNQVADSSAVGEASGRYGVSLTPHVDGDIIINYSSEVERSDPQYHKDGYIQWYGYPLGIRRFDIPINGSGSFTLGVTAGSVHALSFFPVGVYYYSQGSGSGTAHTTFQWTFVPAKSP